MTSVNRLVTARPYSAPHVEAPDPDIIMRRPATSERTMTPAMASKRPLRVSGESRPIQYGAGNHMRQPRSSVSTTPTSSDGASATALLACGGAALGQPCWVMSSRLFYDRKSARLTITLGVRRRRVQSLLDVSYQIVRVLDTDRQPDRRVENSDFLADIGRDAGVRHARGQARK